VLAHTQSIKFTQSISIFHGVTENARPGKCRTWKTTDQIAGLENAGPEIRRTKLQGWKMQEQIILPLVEYVLIH